MSNIFYNKSHIYLSILYISDFFSFKGATLPVGFHIPFELFPISSGI